MSDHAEATDSEGVPPSIADLIRSHQARTGESLHRVSDRSFELSGHRVTQRYLHDLASGKASGWPRSKETIPAIADGLQTTALAVVLGFAVMNLPEGTISTSAFASSIPPAIDHAPENMRDAILGVIWAATSQTSVRRYLPADALPDVTEAEGLIDDPDSSDRGNEAHGQT